MRLQLSFFVHDQCTFKCNPEAENRLNTSNALHSLDRPTDLEAAEGRQPLLVRFWSYPKL
jgi:hypothetical protein